MSLRTRLGRALSGLLEGDDDDSHLEVLTKQVQGMREEMSHAHAPSPDGWEDCAGLNTTGLCSRSIPMSGHVVGQDGRWWHTMARTGATRP